MSARAKISALVCVLFFSGVFCGRERILNADERIEFGEVEATYTEPQYGNPLGDSNVELATMKTLEPEVPRDTVERMRLILKDRYLRSPLAVVVDTEPTSLEYTKRLWEATFKNMDETGINLVLLPYNSSGMSSAFLTKGISWFSQVLEAVAPVAVGPHNPGGVAFYSILKATEQVPFDSAILLFTGRSAVDEYLAQLTTATLIQKRCKLHVIWCGPKQDPSAGPGPDSLLREVVERTEGEFHATGFVKEIFVAPTRPANRQPADETATAGATRASQEATLAMRKDLVGTTSIPLSVDSTVHKIHVTIVGGVSAASLRQPSGASIDLLSGDALRRWTSGAATVLAKTDSLLELELTTSAAVPGVWTLTTSSDRQHDVTVSAVSRLSFTAAIYDVAGAKDRVDADAGTGSALLRLTLKGVGNVDSVTLVDGQGHELHKLTYQRRDDVDMDANPDEQVTTDLDLPEDLHMAANVFVKVSGQDPTGAEFSRVSPITSERQQLPPSYPYLPTGAQGSALGPVTVGVSANTSLYVLPNTWASIVFLVTNNRNTATLYRFGARDDRGFVRTVQPQQAYIGARLTYNVIVTLLAPAATPYGSTDTVSLIVQGPADLTNKSAIVTIGDRVIDTQRPHIEHSIKTNCRGYTEPNVCQSRIWNTEIEMIDRDAGILDVVSQPPGIRFMNEFLSGTKSTVIAYYSATCCENKVDITVTDTNGNYVKYTINGDDTLYLSAGEIAAIVCGFLLLIILIVAIILAVCICKKNRSKSHDLPVHPRARH